jgi:hypothetical protein
VAHERRVGKGAETAHETQKMNCLQKIAFAHAVLSQQAIDRWGEVYGDLLNVFEVHYVGSAQKHIFLVLDPR